MLSIQEVLARIEETLDVVLKRPRCFGSGDAVEALFHQFLWLRHEILFPECKTNCTHNAYSNYVSNKYQTCSILSSHIQREEPNLEKFYARLCLELGKIRAYAYSHHPIRHIRLFDDGTVWIDGSKSVEQGGLVMTEQTTLTGEEAEAAKAELPELN